MRVYVPSPPKPVVAAASGPADSPAKPVYAAASKSEEMFDYGDESDTEEEQIDQRGEQIDTTEGSDDDECSPAIWDDKSLAGAR